MLLLCSSREFCRLFQWPTVSGSVLQIPDSFSSSTLFQAECNVRGRFRINTCIQFSARWAEISWFPLPTALYTACRTCLNELHIESDPVRGRWHGTKIIPYIAHRQVSCSWPPVTYSNMWGNNNFLNCLLRPSEVQSIVSRDSCRGVLVFLDG